MGMALAASQEAAVSPWLWQRGISSWNGPKGTVLLVVAAYLWVAVVPYGHFLLLGEALVGFILS